jgi:hypothetical protein
MVHALLLSCALAAGPIEQRSAINVGFIEVVALPTPAHVGLYPYVAGSMIWLFDWFTVVPSLGVEWSPQLRRWGLVGGVGMNFALTERFSVDVNVKMIHDQTGNDWNNADFLLGGGAGVSFYLRDVAVSPYLNLFRGLTRSSWSLVPGLNLGISF